MSGAEQARPRVNVYLWAVVPAAVGVLAWALPSAVAFLPDTPSSFWAVALCALLVDVPLFGVSGRDDARPRTTLSICFVLTIWVYWGTAPAVVVQAIAGAVSMIGQRYVPLAGTYVVARLVLAPAVAELLVGGRRSDFSGQGSGLTGAEIVDGLSLAAIWLTVSYGLLAGARATVVPGGWRQAVGEMRFDLFRTTVTVVLGSAVITAVTGWWPLLIGALLFVWNAVLRGQLLEEQRLSREPVSGLLNRQGLLVGMQAVAAPDHGTSREPQPFGLVLVNVQSVLTINQTLGRDLADRVVGLAARRLIEVYGANRVGQLSAENFVILIPDLTEVDAVAATEAAVLVLAPPIRVDDLPFVLDPVGGVALCPEHGRDLPTLLVKAERATAEARRHGRSALLYLRQATEATERRTALLRALHHTLREPARHREIAVLYQPQVELATGRLVGVEALLRWTHPEWGPVPTNEVIEAVGQSEVMHLLTRHVLATVAAQVQLWNEQGQRLRVAVNVSVQDLHDPFFVADLAALLREREVEPHQLTIEITEHMLAGDTPRVAHVAASLARLGVGLSLDDFGTGHASIQQLRRLPLTEVKIEGSYVSGMLDNPVDRAIVTSVHHLARALGVGVVAEGVENRPTALALARLVGTVGQGWHFGHPMTADALRRWWESPGRPAAASVAPHDRHVLRRGLRRWWHRRALVAGLRRVVVPVPHLDGHPRDRPLPP